MIATNRTRRATLAARSTTTRATARIRRNGGGSLVTFAVSTGLGIKAARSVAGSLRKAAVKLGLAGTEHRTHAAGRMRTGHRFSPAQVLQMLLTYRPRLAAYRTAAAKLAFALAA